MTLDLNAARRDLVERWLVAFKAWSDPINDADNAAYFQQPTKRGFRAGWMAALSALEPDAETVERMAKARFEACGYGCFRETGGSATWVLTRWDDLGQDQMAMEVCTMRAALSATKPTQPAGGGDG